ncbi:DUF2332 domain-containing protein [Nocardioides sp. BP30]|uniref:DUF2332 domain-containing protein n=1 Tax=Nocardioides sp. BP30 TaxID=3036374 RepID=UPI00246947C2|nr:DUF2332 domain-containing protein [Nocardioides sp. BP30]WGL52687.1 DUF2332 domain-containing protein [Nocardioides sp. BP30]
MEPYADVIDAYAAFAREVGADSATFRSWAEAVVEDPEVVAWIGSLPGIKQQPNLVFAAARWHGVPAPGPYRNLREALLADGAAGPIRATILARATQTNEVGRLATLVPAFARIAAEQEQPGRPLALLEAGASAGLCLYPDRWGYAWQTDTGEVLLGAEPRLSCRVKGTAPLPAELPSIGWRGGIDLHPLAVTDADQMGWLEQLVWPEHDDRRTRLRQAVGVARDDPPRLVAGDLIAELPRMVREASGHGTVVVFHSAVIAYLEPAERERFDRLMRGLVAEGACHWVSNESKTVLPGVTASGPEIPAAKPTFVLGIDGRAVAHTHGHGRSMHWFG